MTTWYCHSGNGADGAQDGTSAHPYATIGAWHTAVNGGGFSTTGIGSGDVLVLASSEGNYFREGPQTLNFGGSTTKSLTVRAWNSSDPAPGNSLRVERPVIRGDVVFASLTLVGSAYVSDAFPSNVDTVLRLLYKYEDATRWTKEGFRTGHFACVTGDRGDTTNFDGSDVPNFSGRVALYNKTTRKVYISKTNFESTYGGTMSTTATDFAYLVSVYGSSGTTGKTNAGLCFQNCYNCVMDGLEAIAFYNTTGWYGFSMEGATNSIIRNCKTTDTSHHGVGFTSAGASHNGCTIENCEVYGLAVSGAAVYCGSDTSATNMTIRGVTAHLYSVLDPNGAALTALTLSPAWIGSQSAGTSSGTTAGILVDNCRFQFYPAYLSKTAGASGFTGWTTSTPADAKVASTYPIQVRNCEVINSMSWLYNAAAQAISFTNCVLDFSGFGSETANHGGAGGVIEFTPGGSQTSNINFTKCVLTASCPGIANSFPLLFGLTSYTSTTTKMHYYFDSSAVGWFGQKVSDQAYFSIFATAAGSTGSLGIDVWAKGSVFGYFGCPHREAAAGGFGTRKFVDGDNNLASPGTEIVFHGCGYFNVVDGEYSKTTTRDDWSEWTTLVDTTGIKFTMNPLVGLPYRAVVNPALPDSVKAQFSALPNSPGVQAPTGVPLRGRGR